jgi:translation initiation factor IF-2
VCAISENDIKTATGAENPIIIGFHVEADKRAVSMAERFGLAIHTFDIIYKLTEWLAPELEKRIPKEMKEEILGRAHIIRIFSEEKQKQIIGGKVAEGALRNKAVFRIIRRGNTIGEGTITELQQARARVPEVSEGNEFGAMVESKIGLAKGDTIELYIAHG